MCLVELWHLLPSQKYSGVMDAAEGLIQTETRHRPKLGTLFSSSHRDELTLPLSSSLSLSHTHLYPHVTLPIFKSNSHFLSVSLCVSVWVLVFVCASFLKIFQRLNLREIIRNLLHHSWALIRLRARLLSDGSLNRGPAHPPQFWEIIWSLDSLIMHGRRL